MNLLEQCQKWTEAGEYQKIIDTITSIDEESRTPEINSELARAYNNIAESEEKEYFQKALDLLLPYEEYFGNEHKWNFRTAFSYYYLDKDSSYFVVNNDEVTIDITKVKENNPSFLDDDYFIDIAFYLKIDGYTGYETDLPSVTLSSNDTNVIKDRTIRYYINGTTTISKLYFNNNISKISLKLSSLELSSGAVASFNNVRFAFYSYVR